MSKYDNRRNLLREKNSQNNDQWIEEWESKFLQDPNLLAIHSIDVIQGRPNYKTHSYSGFNEILSNPVYHVFRSLLNNPGGPEGPILDSYDVNIVIDEVKNEVIIIDDVQNSLKVARRTFELLRDQLKHRIQWQLTMVPTELYNCISEIGAARPLDKLEGEMTCKAEIRMMIEYMTHYAVMFNKMVLAADGDRDDELIDELRSFPEKHNLMIEQSTVSNEPNSPDLGVVEPTTPVVSNNPNIKPATIKNITPVSLKLRREIKTKNYIIIGLAILVVALIFTNPTILKMIKR